MPICKTLACLASEEDIAKGVVCDGAVVRLFPPLEQKDEPVDGSDKGGTGTGRFADAGALMQVLLTLVTASHFRVHCNLAEGSQ